MKEGRKFAQNKRRGKVEGCKGSFGAHPARYHRARDASRNLIIIQTTSSFERLRGRYFGCDSLLQSKLDQFAI